MKVFVVGLPRSGRTTVAKTLAEYHGWNYIDAMSWVRSTFRALKDGEHYQQYEDDYQQYLSKRMMVNPNFISDHILEMIKIKGAPNNIFVIDGIASPKDFITLFDYRKDVILFLNRTDNEYEYRDHENIGVSVIRDYCFWMSSAGLLTKNKWLEYNFKMQGEDSEHVKIMGAQNSVIIARTIKRAVSHLIEKLKELADISSQ